MDGWRTVATEAGGCARWPEQRRPRGTEAAHALEAGDSGGPLNAAADKPKLVAVCVRVAAERTWRRDGRWQREQWAARNGGRGPAQLGAEAGGSQSRRGGKCPRNQRLLGNRRGLVGAAAEDPRGHGKRGVIRHRRGGWWDGRVDGWSRSARSFWKRFLRARKGVHSQRGLHSTLC